MIRIETHETGGRLTLQVEGRLAGAYVPELENCWHAALADHANRDISVDLKGIVCVDRAGRYLLQLMHINGVSFTGANLATQDILDQSPSPTVHP